MSSGEKFKYTYMYIYTHMLVHTYTRVYVLFRVMAWERSTKEKGCIEKRREMSPKQSWNTAL